MVSKKEVKKKVLNNKIFFFICVFFKHIYQIQFEIDLIIISVKKD